MVVAVAYLVFTDLGDRRRQSFYSHLRSGLLADVIEGDAGNAVVIVTANSDDELLARLSLLESIMHLPRLRMFGASTQLVNPEPGNRSVRGIFIALRVTTTSDADPGDVARSIATRLADKFPGSLVAVVEVNDDVGRNLEDRYLAVLFRVIGLDQAALQRTAVDAVALAMLPVTIYVDQQPPLEDAPDDPLFVETTVGQPTGRERNDLAADIAGRRGVSNVTAISIATSTLDWIDRQVDAGATFYLRRNGVRRRVTFPR